MCFPGLHISLGVFDRLWELLEASCCELDAASVETFKPCGAEAGPSFTGYITDLHTLTELKSKRCQQELYALTADQLVTALALHISNPTDQTMVAVRREYYGKARGYVQSNNILLPVKQISQISATEIRIQSKYKSRDGPFMKSLSQSLDTLHVQRQAYHGGTFVSNHVHKLLKVKLMTKFTPCPYTYIYTTQSKSIDTLTSGLSAVAT